MNSLVGTGALVRLALRRDRILLPVFLVLLAAMVAAAAYATADLYPDTASRVEAATAVNSATGTLAMFGPIHDVTSLGALSTFKMGIMGAIAVAVLVLFIVVRHTRSEEETGRLEMLGATVVGRRAPLTAALIVAGGASVAAGLLTTLGLIASGMPVTGSLVSGAGYACLGIAFASVAALAAQITRSARTAVGIGAVVLGVAYLLRAVADVADGFGWLTWFSLVGWWQQSRPYAGDRWWPLLILLVFAAAVSAIAYVLAARRDFAAGLLPDRPGPATAAASLRSPLALAWRLQRGSLIAWAFAFAAIGLVIGSMTSSIGDFLNNPTAKDLIAKLGGSAQSMTDAYIALELGFAGVAAAVFGVQAALRLRSEETALRAEPVLATAVGRLKWAWSHLSIALGGSALLLVVVGLCTGAVSALQLDDGAYFGRVLLGALVQIPAVWLVIGIGVAAFGILPRFVVVGWLALAGFVLLGEFGSLFDLNQIIMDVSPFAHVPRIPGSDFAAAPLIWLTAIAAGLVAIGLAGFRRRDMG